MDIFETIRQRAALLHARAVGHGADPWQPWALACAAADLLDCDLVTNKLGSKYLKGGRGFYDPTMALIVVERLENAAEQALLAGHELGHVEVHKPTEPVILNESDPARVPEPSSAVERLVDYGQRERREVQMDLFAREFVLPRARARQLFVDDGLSAQQIAERTRLPYAVVAQQIFDAVLLPAPPEIASKPLASEAANRKQDDAVAHGGSPFQLQAGPGTGKTRTLIKRVEKLLDDKVDPQSILVLTFSNKAAGELRERLAARREEAGAVWIGTFHAFGLDVLRRFSELAGLPPSPRLLDKVDAVDLLEEALPSLGLRHFRNLHDPARDIGDFLRAIARAKDELADAAEYRRLAGQMLEAARAASDLDAIVDAEKIVEVAQVYETYERILTARQLLDFGDLIMRPVRLIEAHPEVGEALRQQHVHILVDEYQDVNRASVVLLKTIAGAGENLWVVGDSRQSIYRFRGASSVNMARFATDFPKAQSDSLDRNYRSYDEVVGAFSHFATDMLASKGVLPLDLKADKGHCDERPQLRAVEHRADEGAAVAAAILELKDRGVAFRDQAVLCRGNGRLAAIAEALEQRNIPVLYLGSLFEREEIRNLLALLALLVDPRAGTLARVATMPEYRLSLSEVAALLKAAGNAARPMDWAATQGWTSDAEASARLARLTSDLSGFKVTANPWYTLAALLLDKSDTVRDLARATQPRDIVRGIALWQFLSFCTTLPDGPGLPISRMLERIRRLVLLSEERDLRQMPAAAEAMDAVRVMTVHGAKGLEWEAVHLPGLNTSSFPLTGRPMRCLPPDGLIAGAEGLTGKEAIKQGEDEEEECLFFVALSRARRSLRLYTVTKKSNGASNPPSKFLKRVASLIDGPVTASLFEPHEKDAALDRIELELPTPFVVTQEQLQLFEKCARRFFYTHILQVPGRKRASPFARLHDVVYEVVGWLRDHSDGRTATQSEMHAKFEEVWTVSGPTDHPDAATYKTLARELVEYLIEARQGSTHLEPSRIELSAGGLQIAVTPDEVRQDGDGIRVRRIRTGKRTKSEMKDDIVYRLYAMAAQEAHGGAAVEVVHLTDRSVSPVTLSATQLSNSRKKLGDFSAQIGSGVFPADPKDERSCPNCPHFIVCGAVPSGILTVA